MKISIVGSRSFQDFDALENFIKSNIDIAKVSLVVSGGALGADFLGEVFASKYNIPTKIFKPDWDKYGKKAGFIRNELIIQESDVVFAFWDGESHGTLNSINHAKRLEKTLFVLTYKEFQNE